MKFLRHRLIILLLSLACLGLPALAQDTEIDSTLWDATASVNSQNAKQAIDGDRTTRWDTEGPQQAGQWFQLDLGETRAVSRLIIDCAPSPNDYPRRYELTTSLDGQQWDDPQSGRGSARIDASLSPPRTCRYIRITIPPGAELSGGFWSIHEIKAYGPADANSPALPRPAIHWHVVKPVFPTRDEVIAGYDIRDFGIAPDKDADISAALKLATRLLARAGGGVIWLPVGHYKLSAPISLDNNTTIRGDWAAPEPGKPIQGTVLEMTAGKGNADGPPGISLANGSAVIGINFWYPEQTASAIVPYPVTLKQIGGTGMNVENVTFVNSYRGFACGPEGCALFFLRNVYGTPLETGISIDGTSDIGRMEKVRFSPAYWAGSGLPNSPSLQGPHAQWMAQNGTGVAMRRNDWSYGYDVQLEGYRYGFQALASLEPDFVAKGQKNYPNGQNAKFRFINCQTAIHCENVADVGMMFHDVDITGAQEGILADETFSGTLQVQNSRISASDAVVRLKGRGQILFSNCVLTGPSGAAGTIDNDSGFIELMGCLPAFENVDGTTIGLGQTHVDPAADSAVVKIPDPYTTPTDRFAPPTDRLAVVTDPAYGATGDAQTDDTAAVKKAISAMANGGGTVFFPSGEYRITDSLAVPTGVELRGVDESPHHAQTFGSVLDVAAGRGDENGTPFITLAAHAGLRGLTFHYPEQDTTNVTPYPWMIRGAGEGVWMINLSSTLPYRMVDLDTVRCDGHYVDYVAGSALAEAFRIGGGATGGRVLNCQLNENYYAFSTKYANSPSRLRDGGKLGDADFRYTEAHERAYVVGDCTNEILFQNFVFGGDKGVVLTGKTGPSGWCMGQGEDTCQYDIWAEKVGPGGFPMINNQLVTVESNGTPRSYVALSPQFIDTLHLLGADAWGNPVSSVDVEGGHLAMTSVVIQANGAQTLSVQAPGTALLANAVLRNPDAVLESNPKATNVQLSGVFIASRRPLLIDAIGDLPAELRAISVPGCAVGVPFDPQAALPETGWSMSSSVNPHDTKFALDGDPATRWSTNRPAHRGDEVIVTMDDEHTLSKVRVDTTESPGDYPRRFALYLSEDGTNWGDPVAAGPGSADLRIGFRPQQAKYIRLVNLGDSGGFWSIHEFQAAEK